MGAIVITLMGNNTHTSHVLVPKMTSQYKSSIKTRICQKAFREEFENVRPISCLAASSRVKYTHPVGATFDFFIHAEIISVVGSESSESVARARGSSFKTMFHVGQTCPGHEQTCCSTQTEKIKSRPRVPPMAEYRIERKSLLKFPRDLFGLERKFGH